MERISLKTSSAYRTSHDIETALAWNAIKKILTESGRDELFPYIQSVKMTPKYMTIKTGKPLVNAELKIVLSTKTLLKNPHSQTMRFI
jgi:hypothetical protein